MKVADLKVIKGFRKVFDEYFSDIVSFCINSTNTIKGRDGKIEKGEYDLSFEINNVPNSMDDEGFLQDIRKSIEKELDREVRYISMTWAYSFSGKNEENASISIVVKLV